MKNSLFATLCPFVPEQTLALVLLMVWVSVVRYSVALLPVTTKSDTTKRFAR